MGDLKKLSDPSVNTDDILKTYKHTFTKYIEKEPRELDDAINKIEEYFTVETPRYKTGQEPKRDQLGKIIHPGVEEPVLYQFDIKNKEKITKHLRVIDKSMKVIPYVVMDIRNQLKLFKTEGTPMNFPIQPPPTEPKKPGILEKLGFREHEESEFSKADQQVEALISYIYEVRDKYGDWQEWFFGSFKYDTNRGTWSDIYSREGIERHLTSLHEVFDYWIVARFLPIHQYAMDNHLAELVKDTNEFVKALARMQHESEQMNPGG